MRDSTEFIPTSADESPDERETRLYLPEPPQPGSTQRQSRTQTTVDPPVIPGYHILREIGRGGMGVVYEATSERLRVPVALKVMAAHLGGPTLRKRFAAEAAILAQFEHPNVVRVFEAGEFGGWLYFAMKYVPGGTLGDHLHRLRAGTAEEVVRLMATIARAVHVLHGKKVWHRDLKPANILIGEDGQPLVADFGVAKWLAGEALTFEVARVGTFAYMAPEMIEFGSLKCGPQADVWSLGIILYELLAGDRPFPGTNSDPELPQLVVSAPPPPLDPAAAVLGTDERLERIVLRALAKDPAHRYLSAAELADDLSRWLGAEAVDTLPLPQLRRQATRPEPAPAPPPPAPPPVSRWKWSATVAATALLTFAAALFALGWPASSAHPMRLPPPPLTVNQLLERDGEVLVVDDTGTPRVPLATVAGSQGGLTPAAGGYLAVVGGPLLFAEIADTAPPFPVRIEAEVAHEFGTAGVSCVGLYAGRRGHAIPARPGQPPLPSPEHVLFAVVMDTCPTRANVPARAVAGGVRADPNVNSRVGYVPAGGVAPRNPLARHAVRPDGRPPEYLPVALDIFPDRFQSAVNGEAIRGKTRLELQRNLGPFFAGELRPVPAPLLGDGYGLLAKEGTAAFRNVRIYRIAP